jgi:DNA-binding LacI/PurR family transcriptional regulator
MRTIKLQDLVRRVGGVRALSRASGVSVATISMLLSGRRSMGASVAARIARVARARVYMTKKSALALGR